MGLEACVFQVRDSGGKVRGTGFAIGQNLVVTCAHVVKYCKTKVGELLSLFFYPERIELKAEVLSEGWNEEKDVAFLRLKSPLPKTFVHMGEKLGSFGSTTELRRNFHSFGYPDIRKDLNGFLGVGLIVGQIYNDRGDIELQLESQGITFGMSGAPVLDEESGFIVGMVQKSYTPDATGKNRNLGFAISIETLCKFGLGELAVNKIYNKKVSDRAALYINMAPDLDIDNDFVKRDIEYKQLIEGLLNDQSDAAVAITTALRGAGGYGKTTLAKAVCYDPKIKNKFSDGILWVTLGENPRNLIGHIQDLIFRLSEKRPEFEGLDAAVSYFRDFLREKNLLLVIDDVWYSAHLEPFMQGGPKCVRLITTRINEVVPEGTLEIHVDTMKNKEASKLLLSSLSCPLSWVDHHKIDNLAKRLGYWPLLLKMVNSALKQYIKGSKSFDEALDHINHKLDKRNLTAFDPKNPQKRNHAVDATISVSFDLLTEDEFERFEELVIFPEDEDIDLKTIQKLWGKTAEYDDFDVKELCCKLYNLSLLHTYDKNRKIIKLHDVMRDYLKNIQKQEINYKNSQFLEAYEIENWIDLPENEKYLWKYLSYHLVEAGRKSELRDLLFNFIWIRSKLNFTDVHLLLRDYDFFYEDYPVEMIKEAIQLSANALSKDKKLFDGQLLGRLELFSDNEIKSMLGCIREYRNGMRIIPLTGSLIPPGGFLLRTLEGHFGQVNTVCVIPDENYAISASEDNTLKVWDLKAGKEVFTLKGHLKPVNAVCITPDGDFVISASYDNMLKVWDLKTGKEVRTLTGHSDLVDAVCVTPDGDFVISASYDNTLKVWDLKTGKEVRTLTGHFGSVFTVSVTSDGNYAVSASADKTLKVWDIKTGSEIYTLIGHSDWVNAVSVTSDGNFAVSASKDKTLKVWDLKTGSEIYTLIGHSDWVNAVSVTSDRNYAVSASKDKTLKVWDLKTGNEIYTLTGHSEKVNAVGITSDGKYAVSASEDKTLKVWDIKTGKDVRTLTGHSGSVFAVSVTSDGNYAVSASEDKTIKVWNLKIENEVHTLAGHYGWVREVSITDNGNQAVSASEDKTLKVWDLKTGKEVRTLIGHSNCVWTVCVTPDGNYAVSASDDCTLKVWDLKTGKEVHTLIGHSDWIWAICVIPCGNQAISASSDSTLKVWDLKTGKEVHTLTGHSGPVSAVSVTPDGNQAVSASEDYTLKVWDLKTGKEVHTLIGHSGPISTVSVTPDGNQVVSASSDSTLKVWNLKTGKEVYTLIGHSGPISAVSITPDGNQVVSASSDRMLKVWNLKTGTEVKTLTGHSDWIFEVSVTSDGNYAASASKDRMLKIYDLNAGKEISAFRGDSFILCFAFTHDNNYIVAGEYSGRVHFLLFDRGSEYPN